MTTLLSSRLLLLIATLCGPGTGAVLADDPLERHLFTGYTPTFQSGDAIPKEGVFEIALKPVADIVYPFRSNGVALTNYGGLVTIENVAAGRYAIILSQRARLEIVQLRPIAPIAVTPGSTESDTGLATVIVKGGPLTLQLSGAATPRIMVAMISVPDQRLMPSE